LGKSKITGESSEPKPLPNTPVIAPNPIVHIKEALPIETLEVAADAVKENNVSHSPDNDFDPDLADLESVLASTLSHM